MVVEQLLKQKNCRGVYCMDCPFGEKGGYDYSEACAAITEFNNRNPVDKLNEEVLDYLKGLITKRDKEEVGEDEGGLILKGLTKKLRAKRISLV